MSRLFNDFDKGTTFVGSYKIDIYHVDLYCGSGTGGKFITYRKKRSKIFIGIGSESYIPEMLLHEAIELYLTKKKIRYRVKYNKKSKEEAQDAIRFKIINHEVFRKSIEIGVNFVADTIDDLYKKLK